MHPQFMHRAGPVFISFENTTEANYLDIILNRAGLVACGNWLLPPVTARSPGVRPGLSKGRYGHVSTHLDNLSCPVTGPKRRAHNLL